MAKRPFQKALSVGLSLALCAGMVVPSFAASFNELQEAINDTAGTADEHAFYGANKDIEAWNRTRTETVKNDDGTETETTVTTRHVQLKDNVTQGDVTYKDGEPTPSPDIDSVNVSRDVSLDLNGNNITSSSANAAITVTSGGSLTVNDTTHTGEEAGTISSKWGVVVNNGGEANIDGGKINGTSAGIYVASGGEANINDGEVSGKIGVKVSGENASAEISGGTIIGTTEKGSAAGVYVEKGATAKITGESTVIRGVSSSGAGSGISIWDESTKLVVENGNISGTTYGIAGNGTREWGGTDITVTGGTVTGLTGIYHPQAGTLNISGGNISGCTGIEMRAGTLNVSGGTISGSYIYNGTNYAFSANASNNGGTTLGVGVAVSQHTTNLPITVNITNGTLSGYYALLEHDLQDGDSKDVSLNVTGGNLISIGLGGNPQGDPYRPTTWESEGYNNPATVESKHITFFATGGMSSDEIAEDYLGNVDISAYKTSSGTQNGEQKVGCYEIEPVATTQGTLKYQVGYLTADATQKAVSMSPNGSSRLVVDQFFLNDTEADLKNADSLIRWESNNAAVTVNPDGTVTSNGTTGTFQITATLANGETVTFTVNVTVPTTPGPGTGIEITDPAVPLAAGPVTRAEFIDYLWRHENEPDSAGVCTFTDVPEDHEYFDALCWAEENGVAEAYFGAEGHEDGTFEPDELVTVAAVREFLGNFADVFGTNAVDVADLTTLAGGDDEAVLNCDEVLAEFFGEEYAPAEEDEAA